MHAISDTRYQAALGWAPVRARPLSGGCIADVRLLEGTKGEKAVAKRGGAGTPDLTIEAFMLGYLAAHSPLPVPTIYLAEPDLLLIGYLPEGGGMTDAAERDAADHLAALHDVAADSYGLDRDTLIGPLAQPNPANRDWPTFFRDHRLLYMGRTAHRHGGIDTDTLAALERFCSRIAEFVPQPAAPSLLHGDLWGGNILASGGRISGFIDPAIYYGDAEMDLAFATLFGSLGAAFFARYAEHRPLDAGFWDSRRDIYNLWPLLVHARLFGGHYGAAVKRTLDRFV